VAENDEKRKSMAMIFFMVSRLTNEYGGMLKYVILAYACVFRRSGKVDFFDYFRRNEYLCKCLKINFGVGKKHRSNLFSIRRFIFYEKIFVNEGSKNHPLDAFLPFWRDFDCI
jgi:hypothetical protein